MIETDACLALVSEDLLDAREALDAALNIAKYYKRTEGKVIETEYAAPAR